MSIKTSTIIQGKKPWGRIQRDRSTSMSSGNKKHNRKSDKMEDKKFHSKNIKHDPNAEGARAVFGLKDSDENSK
jgi:hypothetical protein